jgi:hypothetical protein
MNDLLITSDSKTNISILKNALSDYFKILDLGACYFYLNMEIIRDRPCHTHNLSISKAHVVRLYSTKQN